VGQFQLRALINTGSEFQTDPLGENEIGPLEVGKRADLIAVADNLLEDICTLESVEFVMKDGSVMKSEF